MSKTKSKFASLFENFDAELDKQDAQLDAGTSLAADTPEDLAELGVETAPEEADVPAPEAEVDPSGKTVLELDDAQVQMLIAVLGKLKSKGAAGAPSAAPDEAATPENNSLESLSFGGQDIPVGEDEEVLPGIDAPAGSGDPLTPEEATFVDELHDALVGAEEEVPEEEPAGDEPVGDELAPEDTVGDEPAFGEDEEVQTTDKTIPPLA